MDTWGIRWPFPSRLLKNVAAAAFCATLSPFSGHAQHGGPNTDPAEGGSAPKNLSFMFPLKPGNQASVTAYMGELRTNHFHGGLDVRTGYTTGWPVHASAEGYVSRIHVSSLGYGNMVHITHPNGLVTVYAHLESFSRAIYDFVKKEQKTYEVNEIDLALDAGQIKVCKGDIIGLSGNSGSSGGPHLHFEVRDTNGIVLNPVRFGFPEIVDKLNPYFERVGFRSLSFDAQAGGHSGFTEVRFNRVGNTYIVNQPVSLYGQVGLEVVAKDRINNGSQRTGITCLEVMLDGKEIYYHNLESFNIENTNHINAFIDYELYKRTGEKYRRCFNLIERPLQKRSGVIDLQDDELHDLQVVVQDPYRNTATLKMKVRRGQPGSLISSLFKPSVKPQFLVRRGYLIAAVPHNLISESGGVQWVHPGGQESPAQAIQSNGMFAYYALSNHKHVDYLRLGDQTYPVGYRGFVTPGQQRTLRYPGLRIGFSSASLLDTLPLFLAYDTTGCQIGTPLEPLYSAITVEAYLPRNLAGRHLAAYADMGYKMKYLASSYENGILKFQTKQLGRIRYMVDDAPPSARVVQNGPGGFRALIGDNLSGIDHFSLKEEATGRWILLNYDHKRNLVWADKEEWTATASGSVVLTVRDNCGNERVIKSRR